MSAASFSCPGCGRRRSITAIGSIYVYQGVNLIHVLCPTCGNARGKKLEAVSRRVDGALAQSAGSA